ncbi:hypothetical protein FRB99_002489, partial [Tulasnella sp. 403]
MVSLSWVVLLLPTLVVANNTTTPATTTTALATVSPDVETLYKGRIPFIVQTYPVGPGGQYILDGWYVESHVYHLIAWLTEKTDEGYATLPPGSSPTSIILRDAMPDVPTGPLKATGSTSVSPALRPPASSKYSPISIVPLAAAYTDVLPHTPNITQMPPYNFINNATVKTTLDTGIDWWFTNDFTEPACLQQGGLTNNTCPCGTPGLWNPN